MRPKFPIGEHGFVSIVTDTEGNMVGLHSRDVAASASADSGLSSSLPAFGEGLRHESAQGFDTAARIRLRAVDDSETGTSLLALPRPVAGMFP